MVQVDFRVGDIVRHVDDDADVEFGIVVESAVSLPEQLIPVLVFGDSEALLLWANQLVVIEHAPECVNTHLDVMVSSRDDGTFYVEV